MWHKNSRGPGWPSGSKNGSNLVGLALNRVQIRVQPYNVLNKPKCKFFIMSTEFDKNISDWGCDSTDHKNGIEFFLRLVKWPKIDVKKCQNLIFKVDFQRQKSFESFWKKNSLKNINLGAPFLFLSILCSIKIERLLFLKFLKNLAFFDSYFWPFNKTHEKIIAIFVISGIMASIWNVFIKFRWHDKKLTNETKHIKEFKFKLNSAFIKVSASLGNT